MANKIFIIPWGVLDHVFHLPTLPQRQHKAYITEKALLIGNKAIQTHLLSDKRASIFIPHPFYEVHRVTVSSGKTVDSPLLHSLANISVLQRGSKRYIQKCSSINAEQFD